jgi:hypothetical protein
LLTPLGSDPRNYQVGQLSGYRIMDVKKSTTPGENITELIVEMTNSSLAIAALVAINDSNFPATGFEFTNIADLEGGAAAGSAEFFGITVLPLLSFYFNTWDVTNYQDYIDSTSYNPASAALVYDLNDDGSVNITDILTFLSSFGAGFDTADLLAILTEFGSESLPGEYGTVTPEQADLLAWQALISGGGQNKNIYSLFTTVKEPLIGRNVELTMTSSPSDPNSELFSIEVGFNSRNKSMSNASAARQPKKK